MKLYGSLSRLVAILFRKDSQDITVRPNQGTTYTAARDVQLPAGDTAHVLVSRTSTDTLTNKSIDADTNTITNIENADIKSGAAIDATKIADGSVTSTEFQYINSLTSNAQTQIDSKVAKAGDTMTGNLIMDNQKEVRFREATGSGTNYVSFRAPTTLAGDTPYDLPVAYPASSGYHLASTTGGVMSWAPASSVASFKDDWLLADGTTKTVVHNLGSTDVIVQVFDSITGETIEVDSEIRTDANTLDLTASEAPGVSWRVLILAI